MLPKEALLYFQDQNQLEFLVADIIHQTYITKY